MADLAAITIPVNTGQITMAIGQVGKLENQIIRLEKARQRGIITDQQFDKSLATLSKRMNRFAADTGQAEKEIIRFGAAVRDADIRTLNNLGRGLGESQKGFARFGLAAQQSGYQVGDFFVQIASGTSPMVAFTQQFAQLAGFFGGPWGAVVGAVAAIGGAAYIAFSGATAQVKTFQQALSDLDGSINDLKDINDIFSTEGIDKLIEKYGELNSEVLKQVDLLKDISMRKNLEEVRSTIDSIRVSLDGWMSTEVGSLKDIFNTTNDEARVLSASLDAARASSDFSEQLEIFRGLRDRLDEMTKGTGELSSEQQNLRDTLTQAIDRLMQLTAEAPKDSWLDSAISGAQSLVDKLREAVAEKAALGIDYGAFSPDERGSQRAIPRDVGMIRSQEAVRERLSALSSKGGGTGGGGKSTQEDALTKLRERLALENELLGISEAQKRVIQTLGDQRSKYSEAEINAITAEVEAYNLKLEVLKQQEQLAQVVQSSMETAFMSMVSGTESAKDAFKKMAYTIIQELYKVLVVQRLVGSFNTSTGTGSGLVGLIGKAIGGAGGGNVFGGGRASGGSMMAGNAYLVGEHGPELVIPRHSGTVVNANQTAGTRGNGGAVTVQNNITVTGSDAAMVRAEVAKMIPQISNATKAAIIDAKQRGGQMASAFR